MKLISPHAKTATLADFSDLVDLERLLLYLHLLSKFLNSPLSDGISNMDLSTGAERRDPSGSTHPTSDE